jgi:hypothetical protein
VDDTGGLRSLSAVLDGPRSDFAGSATNVHSSEEGRKRREQRSAFDEGGEEEGEREEIIREVSDQAEGRWERVEGRIKVDSMVSQILPCSKGGKRAGDELKRLVTSGDDLGQSRGLTEPDGLCQTELLELLSLLLPREGDETLLEGDGEGEEEISGVVLVDPGLDLREPGGWKI